MTSLVSLSTFGLSFLKKGNCGCLNPTDQEMMKYLVRGREEHMLFDRFSDFEKRPTFLLVKQPQGFGNLQEKSSQFLMERRDTWTMSKFPGTATTTVETKSSLRTIKWHMREYTKLREKMLYLP